MSEKKLVMETVKRLLDKQLPQKFGLFKELVIDSEMIRTLDLLLGVTKLIFEKAVMEPDFSHLYAQLCSDLIEKIPSLPSEELHGMGISVSQILVHNFQELLERTGNLLGESRRLTGTDQEMEHTDKERMVKARLVGSIRLLGELFKKKIFKKRIVHCVIKQLLEHDNEETHLEEANVEAICTLFNSIGDQLLGHPQFNVYFDQLDALAMNPQIEPQWRHMLRDILDQHTNKLIPGLTVVEPSSALNEAESPSAQGVNSSDKEWVLETVKRILDRQIPQKFGILADLLTTAEMITAPDIMEDVTKIIFDKATMEPNFSPEYAALFSRLIEEIPPFPSNESDGEMVTLKHVLLTMCQEVYEDTEKLVAKIGKMTNPDQDMENSDNERMLKLRYVATVCLIGELYKQKHVTDKVLNLIIMKLLNENGYTKLVEANMEAICGLFNSIGNQLDGHPWSYVYIDRLKELAQVPNIEPQWRIMLSDILDRWAKNWIKGEMMPRVKTRICNKYNSPEGCRYGNMCSFAHGQRELGRLIPFHEDPAPPQVVKAVSPRVKTRICNKYSTAEGCKLGNLCNFAHGERELGKPIPSYDIPLTPQIVETVMPRVKTRICNKYSTSEGCRHGSMCNFAHGEREIGRPIPSHDGAVVAQIVETVVPHFKTRICYKYSSADGCRLGAMCNFAHGERELARPIPSHEGPVSPLRTVMPHAKTRIWNKYPTAEGCSLDNMCDFAHGETEVGRPIPSHNELVAPQIVETVTSVVKTHICNKYGTAEGCRLGDMCFFAHGEGELGRPIPCSDLIGVPSRWYSPETNFTGLFHSSQCSCLEQPQKSGFAEAARLSSSAAAEITLNASLSATTIGMDVSNTRTGQALNYVSDDKLLEVELDGTSEQILYKSAQW